METKHKFITLYDKEFIMGYAYNEYEYYQLPVGARIISKSSIYEPYDRCYIIDIEYVMDEPKEYHDEYA